MSYMPPSKSDTHITPDKVYEIIEEKWGFRKSEMFDPCPVDYKRDGLKIKWKGVNYINPPYTLLSEFVQKAIDETYFGHRTIALLPSKTDQQWFHNIADRKYDIFWFRGRLKFKNNKWSATQPHFLVMIK